MNQQTNRTRKEYDQIAVEYQATRGRSTHHFAVYPSFLEAVGDISGRNVIDLACGGGYSTRLLAEEHPHRLVGVDLSPGMIDVAKGIAKSQLAEGIINRLPEYYVADASKPHELNNLDLMCQFNVATAAFLLGYSNSRKMLNDMLANVNHLLGGWRGRFVGITPNPAIGTSYEGYNTKLSPRTKRRREGDRFSVGISDAKGKTICEFSNWYWSMPTLNEAFHDNGFDVSWSPCRVSSEGFREFGSDFWQDFVREKPYLIFQAKKMRDV